MKKSDFLRATYPYFFYRGYSYQFEKGNLGISFDFSLPPDITFQPKIVLENVSPESEERIGKSVLKNLIFHLGMVELLSYWKVACSPEIIIQAGFLTNQQIRWWKNFILDGMGQFFYENNVDFRKKDFLSIKNAYLRDERTNEKEGATRHEKSLSKKVLIPVGGGKDSIVTLELLKDHFDVRGFVLNPAKSQRMIIRIAGLKDALWVHRTIDSKLLELNHKGYLNGHTPFSAYLAFLSVFAAILFDCKYIALSNERSSNEGNGAYLGKMINHQHSKSFSFEKKFHEYSKKYLAKNVEYFSFLRPLYELQIARLFSRYPQYLPVFMSCNEAYKTASGTKKPTGKWCGKCSKCLFVFAVLYPFFQEKQLIKIFGPNLFENKSLIPLMEQLVGERGFKPFECVGTKRETLAAFYLSSQKQKEKPSLLIEYARRKIFPKQRNLARRSENILHAWEFNHLIPTEFVKLLKNESSKQDAYQGLGK